ncbi:MAG: TOBE domain-containing protein, partial [Pseudonocardiales bacterium]
HDQVEAMTMGDRVAVLKDGILQQVDTPRRMYDHPDNVFVAGFIGSPAMNLMTIPLDDNILHFGATEVPVARETAQGADGRQIVVGVRPEDFETVGEGQGLKTVVNVVEELGADAYVYGTADVHGEDHDIIARVDGRKVPDKGAVIYFAPRPGDLHLFSTTTGERLED